MTGPGPPSEDRNRWIHLIKSIRREHNVGLLEAERIALADPTWRRWVERQINSPSKCRGMARGHMREHKAASLIYEEDGVLKLR